ncbi:hypothetical protein MAMMFC1_01301 [Methylomusa anaerophila]|uniref:Uncharacterized protein n=1 Tax=Methylomusa anaerophila TaxID=1930071 RepID=A0A348AHU2_9FIRM|nr:hypothetical protein MAMMFC1_01301 [Methylomusa anaerophila]
MDEVYCLHQVKVEMIDFAYASYRRMLERSTLRVTSITDILREKEQLVVLENILDECSVHGELNDFFGHSWSVLGLDKMRANMEQNFTLKVARLSEIRGFKIQRFGWILSILFGLSGAVNLAQNFIAILQQRRRRLVPSVLTFLNAGYSVSVDIESSFSGVCSACRYSKERHFLRWQQNRQLEIIKNIGKACNTDKTPTYYLYDK